MSPARIAFILLGTCSCAVFLLEPWQSPAYPVGIWIALFALLGMTGVAVLCAVRHAQESMAALAGVVLAFAIVGHATAHPTTNSIAHYATGDTVTIAGIIADEPDRRPMLTKYTIEAETIIEKNTTVQTGIRGKILVTDRSLLENVAYGDRVNVHGILKRPEPIEDFRYDNYLSRYGIYAILDATRMEKSTYEQGDLPRTTQVRRGLYAWKELVENRINQLLPEPHASFMAGLLTGSRKGIPAELTQDFTATGLTHIIAISGYNITVVTAIIMGSLFWLPLRWRLLPAVMAIIAFTVMVGASAAVVRAAIMGSLGLLAMHCGRNKDMRLLLLWTLVIMLGWNPKYLWYDAGFQLSFLSVLGLMEFSPWLGKMLRHVPQRYGIRESLQATIAAQIATLPLSMALFHRISLIAPFANVLVAPAIPLGMLLGAVAVITSVVFPSFAMLCAAAAWTALSWIILIARTGARLPLASVQTDAGIFTMCLTLLMIIALLCVARNYAARAGHS